MAHNYEYRFELKPGKFVYIPTNFGARRGRKIVSSLLKRWTPADYFYHFGKRGGHVAAMRPHEHHRFRASIDLRGFFTSISRTKVHRALTFLGYSNRHALDIAEESCVEAEGRKFLPYGFTQSMALATLAIEKGALGAELVKQRASGIVTTMYVDDILISSDSAADLGGAFDGLIAAIETANLSLSEEKSSKPNNSVEAFNCVISEKGIKITDQRMSRFEEQLELASDYGKEAILRYVGVINAEQRQILKNKIAL